MVISSRPAGQNDVLIVAYYFPPQNASGAQRPHRFFKYLPDFGLAPVVVCGGDPAEERSNLLARGIWMVERAAKATRYHLPWVVAAIRQAEEVIATNPIRCVLTTYPPLATHAVAEYLRRKYEIAWIADFRDPLFLPQEPSTIIRTCGRWAEARIVRRADAVLTNTGASLSAFQSLYPSYAAKMSVLWNGFDPQEQCRPLPAPARPYRVMAHVGEIYGARNPGVLVESLKRLLARKVVDPSDLRVRFIGPLEDLPADCDAAIQELEAAGLVDANRELIPRMEARTTAAEADYLVVLDVTGRERSIQVPAKVFDYVCIGKPILALTTRESSTEWILSVSGIPHVCIYLNDPPEIVDRKLEGFLQFPPEPVPYSQQFASLFDGRSQTGGLAELIRGLCPRPGKSVVPLAYKGVK